MIILKFTILMKNHIIPVQKLLSLVIDYLQASVNLQQL